MNITDVRVRRIFTEGSLRAIVSVTFDDALAVHDLTVIQGKDRLFISMPSKKEKTGTFRDIVHPINTNMRCELEEKVLEAYQMELDRQNAEALKENI